LGNPRAARWHGACGEQIDKYPNSFYLFAGLIFFAWIGSAKFSIPRGEPLAFDGEGD
jgi:hypothetical protein